MPSATALLDLTGGGLLLHGGGLGYLSGGCGEVRRNTTTGELLLGGGGGGRGGKMVDKGGLGGLGARGGERSTMSAPLLEGERSTTCLGAR